MNKKQLAVETVRRLKIKYPEALCSLYWEGEPWKLLVMSRLSAQCTDARVNIVCKDLFSRFPTVEALADASIENIEETVRSCGFYHTKAQNIKDECIMLRDIYKGVLPDDMDSLLAFPGVGRKIANLILGDVYKLPAIVADTHCIRISGRLGFVPENQRDPKKVEFALKGAIQPSDQSDLCHRLVLFGREICSARSPRCGECPLSDICRHNNK